MKRSVKILTLTLLAGLMTGAFMVALAQPADLPEPGFDPRAWFGSAAALAGAVVAIVSLLKANVIPTLSGIGTLVASFATGIGLAVVGSLVPFIGYDATVVEAASFGVTAAVLASGGWDSIKGVLGAAIGSKS